MTTQVSPWPARAEDEAVAIVRTEYSDTHCFELSADGVLTISVEPGLLDELDRVPAFIQATKDKPGIVLNQHNIVVLKRLLAEMS